jgi:cation:H+ antiporter
VLKKELPVLTAVTALAAFHLRDGILGRGESFFLLVLFLILTGWALHQGLYRKNDALGREMDRELKEHRMTRRKSVLLVIAGLLLLVASSRLVVWGAVVVARGLGVSDLVIGLTIVAVGTSLPELASSISAARKGEHDLALGNVLGSNLFNTLAVAGIAGAIRPLKAGREIFYRDMPVMALMTASLFILGYGFRSRAGRINRWEAAFLLASYTVYTLFVISPGFAVR